MPRASLYAKRLIAGAAMLFLLAGLLRMIDGVSPAPWSAVWFLLIHLIYIGLAAAWAVTLRQRLWQANVRASLTAACAMMALWIVLRACKYRYFCPIDAAERLLWYGYYVPQTFAPALGLIAALCLGRRERSRARYGLLLIPPALLSGLILTNDLHQLAFRFPRGIENWGNLYVHGPLYFLAMLWMIGALWASVALLFAKCRTTECKKRVWIPALLFIVGFLSCLFAFVGPYPYFQLPELFCATFAATWEACLQIGLIPCNHNYRGFFAESAVRAQIADADGNVAFRARRAPELSPERMRAARIEPVMLDADTMLQARAIPGGHVYWIDSLAAVHQAQAELEAVRARLAEENELARAENELRARRARVAEQNRLYDGIADLARPRADAIDSLLARYALGQVCVLGAYVKRRCNLALIAEDSARLRCRELYYCVRESLSYLSACGVACDCARPGEGELPAETALLAYDFFEAVVEAALPGLTSMLVRLDASDGGLVMRLELEDASGAPDARWDAERLARLDGEFDDATQDGTRFVTLRVPKGGAAT